MASESSKNEKAHVASTPKLDEEAKATVQLNTPDSHSDWNIAHAGVMPDAVQAVASQRPHPFFFRLVGSQGAGLEARKAFYRSPARLLSRHVNADGDDVEGDDAEAKTTDTGENSEIGVKSQVGMYASAFNMLCYAIALGILSIPAVVANIGVVPFVLLNLLFAAFHWYTGLMYWQLKLRYPRLQNLSDAGHLLYGETGGFIFGAIQLLFSIFLQGNHSLLGATAFYTLGWRNTCAIVLTLVFSIISFVFTLPRSYKLFAVLAFISFSSITVVVVFVMIAANISGPQNAPPGSAPIRIAAFGPAAGGDTSFLSAMNSVTNLLVSYGACPSYMPIISEMRKPAEFKRSLAILILVELVLYTIVGGVIVHALGQYTTSPSLSSLTPLLSKIGYGLGLPVILIAGCASAQVSGKQLLVLVERRFRRGASAKSLTAPESKGRVWIIWIAVNIFTWTCAFILAELIPFFSSFLSVESSLFWSVFIGMATLFHLFIIREDAIEAQQQPSGDSSPSLIEEKQGATCRDKEGIWRPLYLPSALGGRALAYAVALGILAATTFLCVAGIVAAAYGIRDEYATGNVGRPFTCSV